MSREDIKGYFDKAYGWLRRHSAQTFLGIITAYAVYTFHSAGRPELIAATLFTLFTAVCGLQALTYTREKFRLDLFEKRLEYYIKLSKYIYVAWLNAPYWEANPEGTGSVPNDLREAAAKSIFREGFYTARLLFGKDVHQLVLELQKEYLGKQPNPFNDILGKPLIMPRPKLWTHYTLTSRSLSRHFDKYIYFGDYRQD